MAQVGVVYVDVQFNTAAVGANLRQSLGGAGAGAGEAMNKSLSDSLVKFGTTGTRIGRQISFGISAPLALLGKTAVSAFTEFDASMTKTAALTGTSAEETKRLSGQVLGLGSTYGIAAGQGAQALYLIESSGIKGAAATETLDVAAKASAVGLGDMATVAGLLTSAVNAYGVANLPAAKAADILTGAVKESKLPADQLAGSISRVLPIASHLGVGFDQVTASLAAMSLQGTNADEAATQLRGIFIEILNPSKAAKEALAGFAGGYQGLQTELKSKGILQTLRDLQQYLGDDDEKIQKIFGNSRALTGVFGLLNDEGGKVSRIFENTANSAGDLDKAFNIVRETAKFKLDQAIESLHSSLVEMGGDVAPIATKLVGAGATIAGAFKVLPEPLQATTVGLGALLVAAGPLVYSFSSLASLAGGLGKIMQAAGGVAETAFLKMSYSSSRVVSTIGDAGIKGEQTGSKISSAAGLATVGVIGLAAAWTIVNAKMQEVAANTDKIKELSAKKITAGDTHTFQESIDQLAKLNTQLDGVNDRVDEITGEGKYNKGGIHNITNKVRFVDPVEIANLNAIGVGLTDSANSIRKFQDQAIALRNETGLNIDTAYNWIIQESKLGQTFDDNDAAVKAYRVSQGAAAQTNVVATTSLGKLIEQSKALSDAFFASVKAGDAYQQAIDKIGTAQRQSDAAGRAVTAAIREQADANKQVTDAEDRHRDSLVKVAEAQAAVVKAQQDLNDALAGPSLDEQLSVDSAQLSLEEAQKRLAELGKAKPGEKATPVDPLERRHAELDLRRAELDLQRAQEAQAQRVVTAQDNLKSAQDRVNDAQKEAASAADAVTKAHQAVVDADQKVTDAGQAAKDATDGVTQAYKDAIAPAQDLVGKGEAFANALSAGNINAGPFIEYLKAMRDRFPELRDQMQGVIDKFIALQGLDDQRKAAEARQANVDLYNDAKRLGVEGSGILTDDELRRRVEEEKKKRGERAYGGSVETGQSYSVNERGLPELFEANGRQYLIPTTSGRVVPLSPMRIPVAGGDGAGVRFGDINVTTTKEPEPTAFEIRRRLRAEMFLQGKQR